MAAAYCKEFDSRDRGVSHPVAHVAVIGIETFGTLDAIGKRLQLYVSPLFKVKAKATGSRKLRGKSDCFLNSGWHGLCITSPARPSQAVRLW